MRASHLPAEDQAMRDFLTPVLVVFFLGFYGFLIAAAISALVAALRL